VSKPVTVDDGMSYFDFVRGGVKPAAKQQTANYDYNQGYNQDQSYNYNQQYDQNYNQGYNYNQNYD